MRNMVTLIREARSNTEAAPIVRDALLEHGYDEERIARALRSYVYGPHELGTVGDCDPINHGGGFILAPRDKRTGDSPWIEYTDGLSNVDINAVDEYDEDGEPNPAYLAQRVTVYRVDLETSGEALLSTLSWVDLNAVKRSCGYAGTDSPYGLLRTARQRAELVVDVANYYGWYELDSYPLEMSLADLRERWKGHL